MTLAPDIAAAADGQRLCPNCGAPSPIAPRDALWPLAWRCASCGYTLPRATGFAQLASALDETNEGFDLEGIDPLATVDEDHFWFGNRNELVRWLVRRHAPAARRVLEIGCGTGFVLSALRQALPAARITGSELHSRGLAAARRRHGEAVELIQMDARHCHLAESVDLVGAFDVLEHIPQDSAVLEEIARVLKPGGILIATVPQHPWMWSTADDLAHHQRRYRLGELARKARTAGLQPLYQSSFVALAFPLMVAMRLFERLRPIKPSIEAISETHLNVNPAVNGVLRGLGRLEQGLRRAGLPLPFGGSQVLVARRP
ncbi:MAG TPA: class I SAM-dependent methyltransferase [Reyranella sp.]|nr:class I SAM-dependent methyltransferase [Reyranella sp.]